MARQPVREITRPHGVVLAQVDIVRGDNSCGTALTYTDVITLSRESLLHTVIHFPSVLAQVGRSLGSGTPSPPINPKRHHHNPAASIMRRIVVVVSFQKIDGSVLFEMTWHTRTG